MPPERAAPTKGKNMKAKFRRVPAYYAPESRFELDPLPPALLRAVQEAQFAQLKDQLLRERLETVPDAKLSRDVSLAAGEAAALAWVTPFPLLVFPILFAEKAQTALARAAKQEEVCENSRELLAT